jgi:hypothetical protein
MRYELTDCERFAVKSMLANKSRGVPRVNNRRPRTSTWGLYRKEPARASSLKV